MKAKVCHCIRGGKAPIRIMRIHDLEPESGPFETGHDFLGRQITAWERTSEFENDLRLDPRSHHAEAMATSIREVNGLSIHGRPDRRIKVKLSPRSRVGETYLTPGCLVSSFQETFVERTPDSVATI